MLITMSTEDDWATEEAQYRLAEELGRQRSTPQGLRQIVEWLGEVRGYPADQPYARYGDLFTYREYRGSVSLACRVCGWVSTDVGGEDLESTVQEHILLDGDVCEGARAAASVVGDPGEHLVSSRSARRFREQHDGRALTDLTETVQLMRRAEERRAEHSQSAADAAGDQERMRATRDDLIRQLLAWGRPYAELAQITGLSRARLDQIRRDGE